ncbi:unnamed protein product, partial [Didymodactylos carnosus]
MANIVPDSSADTSLVCSAHCPFQKGNVFGLINVKECRVSKKPCSIYGHLQTWHRFPTPACRTIIDAIKKQLPTSANLNIDEATLYFPNQAPCGNQQAQSTIQQSGSTQNQTLQLNNNGNTQDLATLVSLITSPLITLTQQMQQQQQSLTKLQQLLATDMESRTKDTSAVLSPLMLPDLHNLSNDNEDQSAGEEENIPPSEPSVATLTKKKTAVSTRDDLPIMASRSPSPASSPPRATVSKSLRNPPKATVRKKIEDDDENTSEEEDGYVAMALPARRPGKAAAASPQRKMHVPIADDSKMAFTNEMMNHLLAYGRDEARKNIIRNFDDFQSDSSSDTDDDESDDIDDIIASLDMNNKIKFYSTSALTIHAACLTIIKLARRLNLNKSGIKELLDSLRSLLPM